MKVYSIEELHNLIVNQEIDLNEYYYEDHLVGKGVQYEKELLSELLLRPSL